MCECFCLSVCLYFIVLGDLELFLGNKFVQTCKTKDDDTCPLYSFLFASMF